MTKVFGILIGLLGVILVGLWNTATWWKVVYFNDTYLKYHLHFWGWVFIIIGSILQCSFHKIKMKTMKVMLNSWFKLLLGIFYFVAIGTLFKNGNFIIGSLLIGAFMIFLLIIEETHIRNNITEEIKWISNCLVNNDDLKKVRDQGKFYSFMLSALKEEKIKKGMHMDEIYKFLEENNKNEQFSFRPYLYFGNSKVKDNDIIKLHGFGCGIPTPKLILEIKNKILVNWKEA
ncbi:MAG: hypothetical protein NG737_07060 [Omnitrophica bacterium]|nr:hypothetical protein [Candidatus Omnitrophota bacterium]